MYTRWRLLYEAAPTDFVITKRFLRVLDQTERPHVVIGADHSPPSVYIKVKLRLPP